LFETVDQVPATDSGKGDQIQNRFFRLLLLGFVLIFVGMIIVVFASLLYGNGASGFGGVIFIGPFPIVFGEGVDATWLVTISLVLAILTLVAFWVMSRRFRRQTA
jgi:uncharacterized membrane protein